MYDINKYCLAEWKINKFFTEERNQLYSLLLP